jgi:hypothetical protein
MISDDALLALKDRNPVDAIAGGWVTLRKKGKGFIGPCPICSRDPHSKAATRFECNAASWKCAVCPGGGDVIQLIAKREGLGFREAVERLGGTREEVITPKIARMAGVRDYNAAAIKTPLPPAMPAQYHGDDALRAAYGAGWRDGAAREAYEAMARERERKRLHNFWLAGTRWPRTPVEAYLAARGLIVPDNARLRFHPDMPMFADGREDEPLLVHRGGAMLAPFQDAAGIFRGLHITWLDPNGPKGKAAIVHPDTGEVLVSKKMRGTKRGCYIDLGGQGDPRRVISGEGNETVAAVYTALVRAGRDLSATALRVAGDLGNLAGKALKTIAHPTLKTETGRPQRVPGPDPDLNSPAMPVPDSADELVLLGDGDSEPFLTRNALERSSRRHARPGRTIRVRFAPDGLDFNDVMQGKSND